MLSTLPIALGMESHKNPKYEVYDKVISILQMRTLRLREIKFCLPSLVSDKIWIKTFCPKFYITLSQSQGHFIQMLTDMIERVDSIKVLHPSTWLC